MAGLLSTFLVLISVVFVVDGGGIPVDPCTLPIAPGQGTAGVTRFGYNAETGCCEKFIFGGCHGNANNFKTLEQCDKRCPPVNPCTLPIVRGTGTDALTRFGYNAKTGSCEKFVYGGHGGNANNFKTLQQCDKRCPPVNPCALPIVRGPCGKKIPRFGFDVKTGRCEEFTYGGCQGNINNFETKKQCDNRCPPVNPCALPIVRGPCGKKIARFGFDVKTGRCEEFTYGGCQGNINNFETQKQCDKRCPPVNPCTLPIVIGPCKAIIPRFGFNGKTGQCEEFAYGGCQGNSNNFETKQQCEKRCPPVNPCTMPITRGTCDAIILKYGFFSKTGRCEKFVYSGCKGNANNFDTLEQCNKRCPPVNPCKLPIVSGPCDDSILRYGFNVTSGKCDKFIYGGCKGNINNFKTLEQCDHRCPPINPCTLPVVPGPCKGSFLRFGYNSKTGRCEEFIYGGCQGNGNNFESVEQCNKRCPPVNPCALPIVPGPCEAYIERFGFNVTSGKCQQFIYGGCKGNINNFETLKQCDHRCPPINPCTLPVVPGPCKGSFLRFGYNSKTGRCEEFIYGGCQGNGNNFKSVEQCDKRCPPVNPCTLPIVRGPCNKKIPKFGFDVKTGRCEEFIYGGCQGNINNFETKKQCDNRCPPINPCALPIVTGPCGKKIPRFGFDVKTGRCEEFTYGGCQGNINNFETKKQCDNRCPPVNPCALPIVTGPCGKKIPRFGFDVKTGRCEEFTYGGCQGNINNFETKKQCDNRCPPVNPCALPIVTGPCGKKIPRFGFDVKTGRCEEFTYGGCQGNINNFETKKQCDNRCPPVNPCALPIVRGPCGKKIPRFGFDVKTGRCEEFTYGGCQGNINNFETKKQCDNRCPPVNPCALPIVRGPCGKKIPRFGFDVKTGRCEEFTYGGCQGNINNFETKKQCDNRCPPVNPCALPIVTGPCGKKIPRFGFDVKTGRCEEFTYGGCQGNINNFKSVEQCDKRCPPVNPCTLPIVRGPCNKKIPKFGFDVKTGRCEEFIYGGCQGNINNFETKKQCDNRCPPINPCALPIVTGPCGKKIPRFGFDVKTGRCEEFTYGGCQGNINNFETKKQCDNRCPPVNPCALPIVTGPCGKKIPRFGFDVKTGRCEEFTYGGCQGNINNFETKKQCDNRCPPVNPCALPIVTGPCGKKIPRFGFDVKTGRCEEFTYGGCQGNINNFETKKQCDNRCPPVNPCALPIVRGPCGKKIPRFGFDVKTGRCEEFTYGGCQGNINNFETKKQCDNRCPPVNPCALPIVRGPCGKKIPRFGFDVKTGRCEEFTYGGCQGNINNFETKKQCDNRCPPVNPCALPIVTGPCGKKIPRFGFDVKTGRCEEFTYGGCQGNINNFETKKQCDNRCPPVNPCTLPIVVGPCRGAFPRYGFKAETGRCEQFTYGGCQGNANNFDTLQQCVKRCPPVNPCALPIVRGPCGKSLTRFGYDPKAGECVPFTYGGCDGNINNFLTLKECDKRCPPVDPCIQPIVPGPCHEKHIRFGYNEKTGTCQKFMYGGCKGNFNNFETYEECENTCVDPCTLPRDNGPCKAYVPRYFYNDCTGRCEKFIYGGCGGNANNYKTLKECEETCQCSDKKKK